MIEILLLGVLAGLGVAIPFGAISVLIVETGVQRGFGAAWAAGAGAASADGLFALAAAIFGVAAAVSLAPLALPLRLLAAGLLAVLGLRGLWLARRRIRRLDPDECCPPSRLGTYLRLLGLTVINPLTVGYFAALVVGLPDLGDAASRLVFVAGAFGASLAWQSLLAAAGGLLHGRASERVRIATSVGGNLIVLALAARIALQAAAP
ncbi:MAG TPA: LysE family transporter [Candidatus Limnocylindrales bacterium]|nr:LysE family transporter [Candidatus Limnocylindrales bacterium]